MIKIENVAVDIDINGLAQIIYDDIRTRYKTGMVRFVTFIVFYILIVTAACIGLWEGAELGEASAGLRVCAIAFCACIAVSLYNCIRPLVTNIGITELRLLRILRDARNELDAKHYVVLALKTNVYKVPVFDEKFILMLLNGTKIRSIQTDEDDDLEITYEDPDAVGCVDTWFTGVTIPDKENVIYPVTLSVTKAGCFIECEQTSNPPVITFTENIDISNVNE